MADGMLPQDGELQLGPVRLPAGQRVKPDGMDPPVAWVTRGVVADAGLVWSALSDVHGQTGLVPVLVHDDADDLEDLFMAPCDVAELDRLDAAELLEARWEGDRDEEDFERGAMLPFPGLAPPTGGGPDDAARMAALRSVQPASIALIPAARPADVLPTVGWTCFDDPAYEDEIRNAVWIGAILRSWEDRFGAQLLAIGPGAQIELLVQRPPRTMDEAEKIAAEHSAFCTECGGEGLRAIREIAPAILAAPVWTFWWD
jgi:hypothetical protein